MPTYKDPIADQKLSTIILAAGRGRRMFSKTPKLLYKILGKPIISFAVDLAQHVKSDETIVVIGKNSWTIRHALHRRVRYVIQPIPLGSGDAAKKGIQLAKFEHVLILNGDVPLLTKDTISKAIDYHHHEHAALTLLTCVVRNPSGYGRIIRTPKNYIRGIVEQADTTVGQQKIKEINVGVYYGGRALFSSILNKIKAQNRQGEYYLTDIVEEAIKRKKKVLGFKITDEDEIMGINSKFDLSRARAILKRNWFAQLMANGVYIEDPETTNIDLSVRIGNFVHIRPCTMIEGKTIIRDGLTIGPFTWIKNGKPRMKPGRQGHGVF